MRGCLLRINFTSILLNKRGGLMSNKTSKFPFLGILALIFITLKLTGYITWSWWWVLAPIWLPITIVILFVVVAAFILAIADK
jgi:hypothetical protein